MIENLNKFFLVLQTIDEALAKIGKNTLEQEHALLIPLLKDKIAALEKIVKIQNKYLELNSPIYVNKLQNARY